MVERFPRVENQTSGDTLQDLTFKNLKTKTNIILIAKNALNKK